MFVHKNNKYSKWYFSIINKAKCEVRDSYTEKHHIWPSSLGGDNSKENRVELTAREHFICHLLLTKMVEGKSWYSMVNAMHCMTRKWKNHQRNFKINSRTFQTLKENLAITMSHNRKGKKHSDESKRKMSEIHSNRSEEVKQRMADGQRGKVKSEETKKKISEALKNVPKLHGEKVSRGLKEYHAKNTAIYRCEHCSLETKIKTNITRWHGDNCKKK